MMNKQIVEKLRKLRTLKGINQTEMADKLNITRSAYQKIESGESFAWAKYLDDLKKFTRNCTKAMKKSFKEKMNR